MQMNSIMKIKLIQLSCPSHNVGKEPTSPNNSNKFVLGLFSSVKPSAPYCVFINTNNVYFAEHKCLICRTPNSKCEIGKSGNI